MCANVIHAFYFISYLKDVGRHRVQKILNAESDVEVLEEIIAVIIVYFSCDINAEPRSTTSFGQDNNQASFDIVQWIQSLVNLKGFAFNARFFSTTLKQNICRTLENYGDSSALELCHNFR